MSTSNPSEYDPDALQAEIAELGQNLVDLARMAENRSHFDSRLGNQGNCIFIPKWHTMWYPTLIAPVPGAGQA